VVDQRGGGRFAIGAGDADDLVRRQAGAGLREQSMSPMIGTPAARAASAIGWRLSGTPGETTTPSKPVRSMLTGSASSARPSTSARASSRLSQAVTCAPLASRVSTVASPERASPSTA
jgi:hypothetical protein